MEAINQFYSLLYAQFDEYGLTNLMILYYGFLGSPLLLGLASMRLEGRARGWLLVAAVSALSAIGYEFWITNDTNANIRLDIPVICFLLIVSYLTAVLVLFAKARIVAGVI